ncbi:MAG: DUF3347 domain-containing protein [Chitinophagaceae bacterium]|nr:DUF3347 domain-containing protein [Chitinophagaceae bacterium]
MKKILLGLLLFILAVAGYYWYKFSRSSGGDDGPKQEPIALKKHSDTFNLAIEHAMNAYFDMTAAFVDADTANIKLQGNQFIRLLDSIPMSELKNDSANIFDVAMAQFGNIKANAVSLVSMTDIQEMRKDFGMVSENLYPFFTIINYEGEKMYWQNCPMAFGDEKEANWVSKTRKVVNPYLGKNHPVYKGTMLGCGVVKDSIMAR